MSGCALCRVKKGFPFTRSNWRLGGKCRQKVGSGWQMEATSARTPPLSAASSKPCRTGLPQRSANCPQVYAVPCAAAVGFSQVLLGYLYGSQREGRLPLAVQACADSALGRGIWVTLCSEAVLNNRIHRVTSQRRSREKCFVVFAAK